MGRKKKYDRESLVAKAVEIFRDQGFANTSAEMLVEGLGVNRYSLYAEFGSKQELFDAALQRYDSTVVERNFGPLNSPEAGAEEIKLLLEFFGSGGNGVATGRGCLLCNTAVEFGPVDPTGSGFIQRYFARLSDSFLTALTNAKEKGEIQPTVDLKKEADFFTSSILGLFVLLRAKAPKETIRNAAHAGIDHLYSIRP